ncbi:endonuclease/exonuclease/phosphatase family protein [Cecembia sp.]|uniref:endonuclease/exonuclease/phosphatase family protein n=1 Tax=Cecembia sp. TaxID=1898110 RepID=UPI0025C34182|nr:endonuclease/exonuclease/phosphatase family protein [Cecembia sp.]
MAQQTLRILSYNIYHGENPYAMGQSTVCEVADFIQEINPDFVALQEVDSMTNRTASFVGEALDLTDIWANKTKMYGFFAKAIDFSGGGYGEAVLSKGSASFEAVQLPIPKGGEGRSMAIAYSKNKGEIPLTFAGTHLCHEFEENRTAQVKAIIARFKSSENPVIVAGDFNLEPDEEGYALMSTHFYDAGLLFGDSSYTFSTEKPEIRIDYIWLSKNTEWSVEEFKIMNDVVYSDHLPVFAIIQFKQK